MKPFIATALLLVLALPTFAAQTAQPCAFELELKLDKVTFEVGEPIPYEVGLTNTSDRERHVVKTSLLGGLFPHQVEVVDCSGAPAPVWPRQISFSVSYSDCKIRPGETLVAKSVVGMPFSDKPFTFDRPGSYRIRAACRPESRIEPGTDTYGTEWIGLTVTQSKDDK